MRNCGDCDLFITIAVRHVCVHCKLMRYVICNVYCVKCNVQCISVEHILEHLGTSQPAVGGVTYKYIHSHRTNPSWVRGQIRCSASWKYIYLCQRLLCVHEDCNLM